MTHSVILPHTLNEEKGPVCRFIEPQISLNRFCSAIMEHHSIFTLYICVFSIFFHSKGCTSCLHQERIGLLQLKASIMEVGVSTIHFVDPLLTWVDDEASDCCAWERIKCNHTTGGVIHLKLNHTYGSYLNASVFLPFQQLRFLDLSDNNIIGWQRSQGFERLSQLRDLRVLNLERNLFNNSILPSLGQLTSLKALKLGDNHLQGSLSEYSQVFRNMSRLEVLDLSLNQLDGFLPFHDLINMSKLKILDLSSNRMSGRIPRSILSLNSLEALSIALNDLKDSISGICDLKNLQELDLSKNKFEGALPACLSNLTSLRLLDVSENQLSGKLSPSHISGMTSLEYISISDNRFEGSALFNSLVDHKSLFKFLGFSNCNLNISTDDLLKILYNQYDLRGVDLSHNNLQGNFPNWLIENNTNLEFLVLRNNSLGGHIHFPLRQLVNLNWFDVSVNYLQGQLHTNMGHLLPKLKCLNVSRNHLEGRIPSSLDNMKDLAYLDLIHNTFMGEIPESLGLGCERLKVLLLCYNRLHGHIPLSLFNITSLDTLHMRNNKLTGYIPNNNIASLSLRIFDISGNHISGNVPTWIGNLTTLKTFSIQNNDIDGPIPEELCNLTYLEYLDLSENQIEGPIPSCLINLPSLNYVHLQKNKLTGSIPMVFLEDSKLLTLDLTHNNLSGSIPESLGLLSSLRVLLLRENSLGGIIPRELCRSSNISILDLSHNMLSGSIPHCFDNITFGKAGVVDPLTFEHSVLDSVNSLNYEYLYTNFFGSENLETLGYTIYADEEEVDFMTKNRRSTYKGGILNFMAGVDLSCNHLTGNIPLEIGSLTGIRVLNLSHNQFSGLIPETLSNLKQLESMDLSHNRLSGEIPSSLTSIYTLEVFTVAYNNLSGRVPDMKAQFSTFSETSYVGNPFLCGPPLKQHCTTFIDPVKRTISELSEKHGIDPNSFLRSFVVAYFMCFLGYVIVYLKRSPWLYFS